MNRHGSQGRRRLSVRAMLAMLVVACLVPALSAALLVLHSSYQRERTQLERQELQAARALALAVDRDLASVLATAQVLATSPLLQTGDLGGFHRQAMEVVKDQVGTNVVLSDASGRQLLNTRRPFGEPLPQHGNAGQLGRVFETGQPVISDLFIGGVLQRPLLAVDVPVRRDGRVVYDLSIGLLPERLGNILSAQHLPDDWIAAVFDTTGTIVARTHEPEKFVGKRGTPILVERMRRNDEGLSENKTLEGIPVLGAFSRSQVSQWTVAIGVPTHVLFGPLQQSLVLLGLAVAGLLGVGIGLARLVGGRIASSVRALTGPALALGSGEAVVVPTLHVKEAVEVAQALDTAAELLRQRTAERDDANKGKRLLQARLRLADISTSRPLHELLVATLDEICSLTGAEIGFYHFLLPDQATLSLQAWSSRTTQEFCHATAERQHYNLDQAGLWADAVRRRRSVIYNDYAHILERRGLPDGHAEVRRLMSIPILRDGRIMAVLGVGNKPLPFDGEDQETAEALADMAWDLAQRRQAEDALAERARELAITNSDLEQFAYVASHDLREPLRAVNSYLTLIERRYADKLDAEGREFFGYARQGALRMNDLILDLLEYARISHHGEAPVPVDLADAAAQAGRLLAARAEETATTVTVDAEPALVLGNPTELVRLFQNLLSNAIKYRVPGRPARVELGWRREDGDWLAWVRDNGIGIAPEFQSDIFKIFRRLHTTEQYEGTGIGLAVCQKIIKNMGGRIWVDSVPGEGATFYFTVAAAPP